MSSDLASMFMFCYECQLPLHQKSMMLPPPCFTQGAVLLSQVYKLPPFCCKCNDGHNDRTVPREISLIFLLMLNFVYSLKRLNHHPALSSQPQTLNSSCSFGTFPWRLWLFSCNAGQRLVSAAHVPHNTTCTCIH